MITKERLADLIQAGLREVEILGICEDCFNKLFEEDEEE